MNTSRLNQLLEMLKAEPNDSFLKYALATEYIKLNELSKALAYFQDLVQNDPEYVGTYYHLAKLYLQMNQQTEAISTYEQGMLIAHRLSDQHALSELRTAYNALMGLDYEDD